jgi:hypothetical protein
VFHPLEIFSWLDGQVELVRFDYVDDGGKLHKDIDLKKERISVRYGCGIYTFKKANITNVITSG